MNESIKAKVTGGRSTLGSEGANHLTQKNASSSFVLAYGEGGSAVVCLGATSAVRRGLDGISRRREGAEKRRTALPSEHQGEWRSGRRTPAEAARALPQPANRSRKEVHQR
jgi:hypothetical protein